MRPAAAGGGSAMKESEADVSVWSSMFEEDEGAYVDVDVARATVDPDRDRQRQREDEGGGSPHLPQLRVSDYGAEEFWHQRWDANAAAGYEWYTVSAAELWPVLRPLCAELRLCEPLPQRAAPRAVELGCGLSRICLDLAGTYGVAGLVATDMVPQAVEVLRGAAQKEGLHPPALDFAVENALRTSYADRSFLLVLDKALSDSLALNSDETQLATYAKEAARLTAEGGYCVVVTAWDAARREERCKLFAPLQLVSTVLVHQHGPAQTNAMVLRR